MKRLSDLELQIEDCRRRICRQADGNCSRLTDGDTVRLSQELDLLIMEYLREKREGGASDRS